MIIVVVFRKKQNPLNLLYYPDKYLILNAHPCSKYSPLVGTTLFSFLILALACCSMNDNNNNFFELFFLFIKILKQKKMS
ncbi:hypothetical protein BpHYR1_030689 [Brachionus plicatilis]|uniref:Uncharacterized protein n=1 Tax=Brachionus plicatilis TaxID=10195 RepID=A0A3M7SB07_BRAPC|nr:hypothetical protein BpHYR1_030689 [Brachionus plicatilis]